MNGNQLKALILSEVQKYLRLHQSGYADDAIPEHWRPILVELETRGVLELSDDGWRLKEDEPKQPEKTEKESESMKVNLKELEIGVSLNVGLTADVELDGLTREKGGGAVLLGSVCFMDADQEVTKNLKFKLREGPELELSGGKKLARQLSDAFAAQLASQLDGIAAFAVAAYEADAPEEECRSA